MTEPTRTPAVTPDDQPAVEIERLPREVSVELERPIVLTGDAARQAADSVGRIARTGWQFGRRATEQTYRLVPSEKVAGGLADGTLTWAKAAEGDASVLVKHKDTGRIAGRGVLEKSKPSPAKLLGPAAWEAMAMATQQHYLVEINSKLEGIEKGVDELLNRGDDDKVGLLRQANKIAADAERRLEEGGTLSSRRLEELGDQVTTVDQVWHQLQERVHRQVDEYERGGVAAEMVEHSFALLLFATQVLARCSAVLTRLPYTTVAELQDASREERERVVMAAQEVRSLAGVLHAAHLDWTAQRAARDAAWTRNPIELALRKIRDVLPPEPQQAPLSESGVARCEVAATPATPRPVLIQVRENGTVLVGDEPDAEPSAPAE